MRRWLLIVWVALLAYTVWLAPSSLPSDTLEMTRRLTLFDWPNPALCALWYFTGTLLFLHATFYFAERPQHGPHPLAVLVLSPLLGSLVLLPYYALRQRNDKRRPWHWPWRFLRCVLALELVGFSIYGLMAGDLPGLGYEVTHRKFSCFLLLDCVILIVLLPLLAAGKLNGPRPG